MKRPPALTLDIIEHIGLPLINATARANTPRADEVQHVRDLLDRTVQCAHELEKIMDTPASHAKIASQKLTLAAISSRLIAAQYEAEGQIPTDRDVRRIVSIIENTITNSNICADFDEQNNPQNPEVGNGINLISDFLPAINAIAEFSYGQSDVKLIQSVSETLSIHTERLCDSLIGHIENNEDRAHAKSVIIKTLIALYGETHSAETRRIMKMDEKIRMEQGSQITIDVVWRAFEKKYTMLAALVEGLIPQKAMPETQETGTREQAQIEPEEISAQPKDSPLSFFKRKT
jgi:hypothetical protein